MKKFVSDKAVVALGGGLDSTCLLLKLLSEGKAVRAYGFNYGQKHQIELKKARRNVRFLQEKGFPLSFQEINLVDVFAENTSSLVASTGLDIPHGNYNEDIMRSTVVPLRNVIFSSIIYSKAINWAVQTDSNVVIALGLHSGDHAVYPDCRPESHRACKKAYELSDWNSDKVDYEAPFVNVNKGAVLAAGLEAMQKMGFRKQEMLRVLRNTHSCYDPTPTGESCGLCGTCRERLEAFAANGLKDPVKYVKGIL
ncbi:MAG: 7-cyano-7-deazaguanine synthase [Bacteroidales bacterium]|jgi:7-cyano-7-deazaguanine synthase|nr:7-cyano-7-deazaguanine synthase [Bacteroidales bacterium]